MNEMGKLLYTVVLIFQVIVYYSECCIVRLEAEHGTSNGVEMIRGRASNDRTVLLKMRGEIEHTFRISSFCGVSVTNVTYSNDGLSDIILLTINGTDIIGSFKSRARSGRGRLWNVFRSTGPVGNYVGLSPGEHTLVLTVMASEDDYGVEIDETTLSVVCANNIDVNSQEECPKSEVDITLSGTPGPSKDSGKGLIVNLIVGIAFGIFLVVTVFVTCIYCSRRCEY